MLNIERALKQDRLLRAMTGLNRKAFEALLATFRAVYEEAVSQQPRQRAVGGGRKARLRNPQDKLFYILEEDIAGSIPEEIPIELDLGFLGVQKQYDNIRIPHKKPKGGELSEFRLCLGLIFV